MNLMQLKYFNAICTFGTVSGAAEYLHIAQPSLSNAIKELEGEFGVLLFSRHHRGMVLTPAGEELHKLCGDILGRAAQAEKIMKDLGRERKTLKLGVPPMTGSLILPNIYGGFLERNPDISIEVVECGRREMQKNISEDYLDLAFISHNRGFDPELAAIEVARLEIVCCTVAENPLSKKDKLSPSELSEVPLVMFEDGFFQTAELKRWFAAGGVEPNIIMQTSQLSTMLSLISSNRAAGFMFKPLIDSKPEFIPVSLDSPIFVSISLVRKKDRYLSAGMKRFIKYAEEGELCG